MLGIHHSLGLALPSIFWSSCIVISSSILYIICSGVYHSLIRFSAHDGVIDIRSLWRYDRDSSFESVFFVCILVWNERLEYFGSFSLHDLTLSTHVAQIEVYQGHYVYDNFPRF